MTLEERRTELKEKWSTLSEELSNINYNKNMDLNMWYGAKQMQIYERFEKPLTKENLDSLDELITNTYQQMFFDAIALGGRE